MLTQCYPCDGVTNVMLNFWHEFSGDGVTIVVSNFGKSFGTSTIITTQHC